MTMARSRGRDGISFIAAGIIAWTLRCGQLPCRGDMLQFASLDTGNWKAPGGGSSSRFRASSLIRRSVRDEEAWRLLMSLVLGLA